MTTTRKWNKIEVYVVIFDKDIDEILENVCFYRFIGYGLINQQHYHQTKGWTNWSVSSTRMCNNFEVCMVDFYKDIEETFGLSTLLPRYLNMTQSLNRVTNMNVCWILNMKLISPRWEQVSGKRFKVDFTFIGKRGGGALTYVSHYQPDNHWGIIKKWYYWKH